MGDFMKNISWISGPEFLCSPVECWPKSPLSSAVIALDDPEIKKVTVNTIGVEKSVTPFKKLIHYFSSWMKLKQTVAWFLKFKALLWGLCQRRKELCTASEKASLDSGQQLVQRQMDSFKKG